MAKRRRRYKNNSIASRVLPIVLIVLFALSLVGMLGGLGGVIKQVLLGVFGVSAYAVSAVALVLLVLRMFGFSLHRRRRRMMCYAIVLLCLVLLYLQIYTSSSIYYAHSTYGRYLERCYARGGRTSGGFLGGIFAYPFLALMGKYSAILIAVAFFIVLFFAVLPSIKVSDSGMDRQSETHREKPAKNKRAKHLRSAKKAAQDKLRLFVDKVVPGQKDAQLVKMRSVFNRDGATFCEYDVNDYSPLDQKYSKVGVVPERIPERYGLEGDYKKKCQEILYGNGASDLPKFDTGVDVERDFGLHRYGVGTASENAPEQTEPEMPKFMQNLQKSGEVDTDKINGSTGIDGLQKMQDEGDMFDKFKFADETPATSAKNTAEEVSGIAAQQKAAPRIPQKKKIISDISEIAPEKAVPQVKETPKTAYTSSVSSAAPAPKKPVKKVFLGEDTATSTSAPANKQDEVQTSFAQSTITPRDASLLTPKPQTPANRFFIDDDGEFSFNKPAAKQNDEKRIIDGDADLTSSVKSTANRIDDTAEEFGAKPVQDVFTPKAAKIETPKTETYTDKYEKSFREEYQRSRSVVSNDVEEREQRTRKPRSDIGGTHYSQAKAEATAYVPPQKASQMNFEQIEDEPARPYVAPPVSLLKEYPAPKDEENVEESAATLTQALSTFGITTEVVDHKTGPTFTQFALTLPDGVSVNKVVPLEKDIKRKLLISKSIRIIPSVPDMDAFGIEIPNKTTTMVGLRQLISAPQFDKPNSLYFAIGVDVSGKPWYGDLTRMPHLLVAGSTGSGKSVCLNVMICSLMYHYSPEQVRFIMVDPKKVELSIYRNMPHMIMPNTVTDVAKAINALNWAITEMDRRYDVFQECNCRNIEEYNALQKRKGERAMYYIVVIVDEMADLMSRSKREVEDRIQCLTSKARAAGIHLVVATQRPSVDVITGTIKNNIPTRIAFMVTSFNDSRTILDKGGAESLFGHGDMLYNLPSEGEPIRLQGPFVDSDEIEKIVEFIKSHNDCRFDSDAENAIQAEKQEERAVTGDAGGDDDDDDELFADALLYVIQTGQASSTRLQRKYKIGFPRASRLIDMMEERGYVSALGSGNQSRTVLTTLDEYYEIYGEDGIDGDEI